LIDLHIHTQYSDGQATIPEVFEIATTKKLEYISISDHFTTTSKQFIIPTLSRSSIPRYLKEIEETACSYSFRCFLGIEIDSESNILDVEELPLERFELINFEDVSSLNILNKIGKLIKKREIRGILCLAHPNIHIHDGHHPINLETIEKHVIPPLLEHDIAFELNSRYTNRWLKYEDRIKLMIDEGVKISIGSDAHAKSDIGEVTLQYDFLKKIGGLKNLIKLEK
jgi:histidinol phosphatase-like PHP family hydrolase